MITNMTGAIAQGNETLKGIKRSRFSFHFNTARRRRWLLVQLVSAPSTTMVEEDNTCASPYAEEQPVRRGLANRLEDYQMSRMQRVLV